MAILTGPEIEQQIQRGNISIRPFRPEQVSEASYDVRLFPLLLEYIDPVVDTRKKNPTREIPIPSEGFVIYPGKFYLGCCEEFIEHGPFVPHLSGKSSMARLSLEIHRTAGHGEPHFEGRWVMEISTIIPCRVYAGDKIGQVVFSTAEGVIKKYGGKYQHQHGPVASRSWMDAGK